MKRDTPEVIQNGDICVFVCLDEEGQKEVHHGIYISTNVIPGMFLGLPNAVPYFVFDLGTNSSKALENITLLGIIPLEKFMQYFTSLVEIRKIAFNQ